MNNRLQLSKIKEYFVHELKVQRSEKGLIQDEMAKLIGVSRRTYQRLEDKGDLECPFSSAISSLYAYSKSSNYNLVEWIVKAVDPNIRTLSGFKFIWETNLIEAMHSDQLDQRVRRKFTGKFSKPDIGKIELVLAIGTILLTQKSSTLENWLRFFTREYGSSGMDDYLKEKVFKDD